MTLPKTAGSENSWRIDHSLRKSLRTSFTQPRSLLFLEQNDSTSSLSRCCPRDPDHSSSPLQYAPATTRGNENTPGCNIHPAIARMPRTRERPGLRAIQTPRSNNNALIEDALLVCRRQCPRLQKIRGDRKQRSHEQTRSMETALERSYNPSCLRWILFAELCYVFDSCKNQPNPANVARVPIVLWIMPSFAKALSSLVSEPRKMEDIRPKAPRNDGSRQGP